MSQLTFPPAGYWAQPDRRSSYDFCEKKAMLCCKAGDQNKAQLPAHSAPSSAQAVEKFLSFLKVWQAKLVKLL